MAACANCGKTGLKRTYEVMLDGGVQRVGSECARHFRRASSKDHLRALRDRISAEPVYETPQQVDLFVAGAFQAMPGWYLDEMRFLATELVAQVESARVADKVASMLDVDWWWAGQAARPNPTSEQARVEGRRLRERPQLR